MIDAYNNHSNAQVNKLENRANVELDSSCERELRTFVCNYSLLYYKMMKLNIILPENLPMMWSAA